MPLLGASPLAIPEASDLSEAFQQVITIATPATGTSPSRVVPGDAYEQVVTATVSVSTSAAVANRSMEMIWQDGGGNNYCIVPANAVQVANTTVTYAFNTGSGGTYSGGAGTSVVTIPSLLMLPGHKLFFQLVNIDGSDFVSAVSMSVFRVPTSRQRLALVTPIATPLLA